MCPHALCDLLCFVEPIQAHVGVEEPPIGRFHVRLQLNSRLACFESLFELPQPYVVVARVVMKSPDVGIASDTRSIGVNGLVQLASRLVVAGRDAVLLTVGDAVDQGESLALVFGLEPCVPSVVESGSK